MSGRGFGDLCGQDALGVERRSHHKALEYYVSDEMAFWSLNVGAKSENHPRDDREMCVRVYVYECVCVKRKRKIKAELFLRCVQEEFMGLAVLQQRCQQMSEEV